MYLPLASKAPRKLWQGVHHSHHTTFHSKIRASALEASMQNCNVCTSGPSKCGTSGESAAPRTPHCDRHRSAVNRASGQMRQVIFGLHAGSNLEFYYLCLIYSQSEGCYQREQPETCANPGNLSTTHVLEEATFKLHKHLSIKLKTNQSTLIEGMRLSTHAAFLRWGECISDLTILLLIHPFTRKKLNRNCTSFVGRGCSCSVS